MAARQKGMGWLMGSPTMRTRVTPQTIMRMMTAMTALMASQGRPITILKTS